MTNQVEFICLGSLACTSKWNLRYPSLIFVQDDSLTVENGD